MRGASLQRDDFYGGRQDGARVHYGCRAKQFARPDYYISTPDTVTARVRPRWNVRALLATRPIGRIVRRSGNVVHDDMDDVGAAA